MEFRRVLFRSFRPCCPPGLRGLVPFVLNLFRWGSVEGGWLLFVLLRVRRLSSNATRTSKTSSADLSAGERPRSFLRCALTEWMAASTSICSIVICPHSHACRHYRTGVQNDIFGPSFHAEARKKDGRPPPRFPAPALSTGFIAPAMACIMAGVRVQLKLKKIEKTLSSTFFIFLLNSYD